MPNLFCVEPEKEETTLKKHWSKTKPDLGNEKRRNHCKKLRRRRGLKTLKKKMGPRKGMPKKGVGKGYKPQKDCKVGGTGEKRAG